MNNFDRIHAELATQAAAIAPGIGLEAERFLEIALEIVDAEDQHRISRTNIKQQVESIVLNAAMRISGSAE